MWNQLKTRTHFIRQLANTKISVKLWGFLKTHTKYITFLTIFTPSRYFYHSFCLSRFYFWLSPVNGSSDSRPLKLWALLRHPWLKINCHFHTWYTKIYLLVQPVSHVKPVSDNPKNLILFVSPVQIAVICLLTKGPYPMSIYTLASDDMNIFQLRQGLRLWGSNNQVLMQV